MLSLSYELRDAQRKMSVIGDRKFILGFSLAGSAAAAKDAW